LKIIETRRQKIMTKYYTVSLPEKIIKKIDETVTKQLYTSRADFVKTSIRKLLKEVG